MVKEKDDAYLKQVFVTQTKGYNDVSLKRELWKEISNEFNGKFIISHNSGNGLEVLKIDIPYKNLEIKLSESDTQPLKFRISFISHVDYELIIGYKDSIDRLLKRLGKKEIELGNEKFDNKYLIKSKDSELTKKIITQDIIDNFLKYNIYSLAYTTEYKSRTSNLISVICRTVDDKLTIVEMIRLHMSIIDKLIESKLIE
jgi:hypothetical protein